MLAASPALLSSPCSPASHTVRGEKRGSFDAQRGKLQLQSPEQGHLRPASHRWRCRLGTHRFFLARFPEKGKLIRSLCVCWCALPRDSQHCQPASPPADTGRRPENKLPTSSAQMSLFPTPEGTVLCHVGTKIRFILEKRIDRSLPYPGE